MTLSTFIRRCIDTLLFVLYWNKYRKYRPVIFLNLTVLMNENTKQNNEVQTCVYYKNIKV